MLFANVMRIYLRQYGSPEKARDLKLMLSYLLEIGCAPATMADFSQKNIKGFRDAMLREGYAPASVRRFMATLHHFGEIAFVRHYGLQNPAHGVKPPTLPEPEPKSLEPATIAAIREVLRSYGPEGFPRLRIAAQFEMLLATGVRAGELLSLDCDQIQPPYVKDIYSSKTGKIRSIWLADKAMPPLTDYLAARAKLVAKDSGPVWLAKYRGGWKRQSYESLQYHFQKLGTHAHACRHTRIKSICDAVGAHVAKDIAGHSDLKTTMIYVKSRQSERDQAMRDVEI